MLVKKLHRVNFIPWSTLNIAYAFSYRYVFFTLCFQFHIRSCSHRSRNECCFFGIMGFFLVCFNSNTWYVPKSYFFRLHICFKKRSLIVHKTVANWVKKIAFNATINCISKKWAQVIIKICSCSHMLGLFLLAIFFHFFRFFCW